ncbi:hypothetical protein AOL_s00076g63 [Orbilia oligospora ATCC 24927]|uniref:Ricin B lectin domain-containing protein n=2 Tax=Orbilia oligospora TaxID=2813651 RepID=G1X8V6_ARTOA|nr:hypothetical protein AOL_s00076g63 [Orbilia oligospora ATCC 24927]EGX50299.1 hypothetical protein AOL_s00076g63 [Orbilia oligospora ATCC 24927]KAF3278534.1 hypothetical protein TWF970_004541 [Orbilia oligospora]
MNLIQSSALIVGFILTAVFSQSVAAQLFPDGDYYFIFNWPSWPDRYLTGSSKDVYEQSGMVDVTFKARSYSWETSQLQRWRIKNRSDGTVHIQNVKTTRYLGSGHKFNCTVALTDKTNCATSLLSTGETFKFVEHYWRKGRYHLQMTGYGGNLWQPVLGPAGPYNKPLEIAVMTHSAYSRDLFFQITKA